MLKPSFQLNNEAYLVTGKLLPTNEFILRFSTKLANSKDTQEDKLNKFKALTYKNKDLINNESNLLENSLESIEVAQWLSGEQFIKPLRKREKGWGKLPERRKFTRKMKNNIRQLASAFDKEYKPEQMLFCTFTLPASVLKAYETLSAYSSYIVNRFNKLFNDCVCSTFHRLGVWELQKRGALHLHIIVGSEDVEGLEKIRRKFKQRAIQILDDVTKKSDVDMWERAAGGSWKDDKQKLQADVQYVKKSVARYLAKYLSKGGDSMFLKNSPEKKTQQRGQRVSGVWQPFTPVRWSTWSWNVKSLFVKHTRRIDGKRISKSDVNELIETIGSMSDVVCSEAYQQPLIYQDKVGDSFNIRMILKDDKETQDFMFELGDSYLEACERRKSPIVPEDLFLISEECMDAIEEQWLLDCHQEMMKDADYRKSQRKYRRYDDSYIPNGDIGDWKYVKVGDAYVFDWECKLYRQKEEEKLLEMWIRGKI